jgi:2-polyprenyl-3-methyl-5-hydroxy-6-metoxy-1,4-benzoquinol methylase
MKREKRDIISAGYLAEQKRLHAQPRGYGGRGAKWANLVFQLAREMAPIDAVLDFGCGQNSLAEELNRRGVRTRSFDPAIPQWAHWPKESDLVTCTDVLEHVEPDRLPVVLKALHALTKRKLFTVISLVTTEKTLSDGRQAHLIVRPPEWWTAVFGAHDFQLASMFEEANPAPHKQLVAMWMPITEGTENEQGPIVHAGASVL